MKQVKYYGIGTKSVKQEDGGFVTTSVVISYEDNAVRSRIEQVNAIRRQARKDGVKLTDIYPTANQRDNAQLMSKGMKAQKADRHAKQVAAHKAKLVAKATAAARRAA